MFLRYKEWGHVASVVVQQSLYYNRSESCKRRFNQPEQSWLQFLNQNGNTKKTPQNQTTASKSNDENKPTTARVAERNAYQLTGKRKLTSRRMKFKLRDVKERRRVGIPNNKLSGMGQQHYLQNKSIHLKINWPKVAWGENGGFRKTGRERSFSWLYIFSSWSLLWKTGVYRQERCLILVNIGRCWEAQIQPAIKAQWRGWWGERNHLADTPGLVLID